MANKYPKAEEEERHLVVVNVSPIEFGHILIVPPPEKCLPQVLTEESVAVSIAMVAHSAWLKGLVCGCQQPTGLCQCQSPPLARTVPGTGDHDTEPDDVQFEAATEDEVCKVLKKVSLSESNFKQLKDMVKHRLTASGRDHYK